MASATVICEVKGDTPVRQEILQHLGEDGLSSSPPVGETSKCKHLEMIQGIINRLAGNSAQLKKWHLLAATLLGTIHHNSQCNPVITASALAIISFGCLILDAYYLSLERQFINTYNDAIAGKIPPFVIKPTRGDPRYSILSVSVWPYYLIVTTGIGIALCANQIQLLIQNL